MLKTFLTIGLLAGVVSIASVAHAQALPTAVAKLNVQVGGGYTLAAPDYGPSIQGGSGFVDFDFRPHFGVEADIHYIALITPGDLAENTFLFGPRYVPAAASVFMPRAFSDSAILSSRKCRIILKGEPDATLRTQSAVESTSGPQNTSPCGPRTSNISTGASTTASRPSCSPSEPHTGSAKPLQPAAIPPTKRERENL